MDLKVINQIENPLLERFELIFSVSHAGEKPPRRDHVREAIAKELNTKKGLVVVDRMSSVFGIPELKGVARVYKTAERLREMERKHLLRKNSLLKAEEKEGK